MDALNRHRSLYKAVTPPWKETYRKRCVDRLKNSRSRLLERYRQVGTSQEKSGAGASTIVQEVMEEEWTALQSEERGLPPLWGPQGMAEMFSAVKDDDEFSVLEEIQQELLCHEMSIIEEYERNLQFEEQYISAVVEGLDETRLICPVCGVRNLNISSHCITCLCGLDLNTKNNVSPDIFKNLIESRMMEHMENCCQIPVFSVATSTDSSSSLMISCQACDYLSVIL